MFYKRDFARFRERINKLQIFSRKVHNRVERRENFQKFSDKFTLHGFSYIFNRNGHNFERYFWTICVAVAIASTVYVCTKLSNKYSDRVLITVVEDSHYPVFSVEFPGVAICTKHRVNWARLQLARNKFLPPNADNATVDMFTKFVRRLDSLTFRTFDSLVGLEKEPLHLIDSISVSKLSAYLSFRCEEIIDKTCMWAEKPIDCCRHFILERTTLGMCLVFNSVVSEESRQKEVSDQFYPYRTSKNGEGRGLVFTVQQNMSNVVPGSMDFHGIELMIKNPDQWTDELTYHLRPNTRNAVIVTPDYTSAHEDLKSYPQEFRKCVFQYERESRYFIPDLGYRKWNCRAECRQVYTIAYCNCTIPLFFKVKETQYRECTPSDYICIYNNRDLFSRANQPNLEKYVKLSGREMICPCPPSCESVNYPITLNTVPIYNVSDINTITRIDIYYQAELMVKYVTKLKFTMWDLTAYFGGITALFLGASMLTGAEFLHFVLLEIASYLKEKRQTIKMARKVQPRSTGNY